jgi:hypothetical protein
MSTILRLPAFVALLVTSALPSLTLGAQTVTLSRADSVSIARAALDWALAEHGRNDPVALRASSATERSSGFSLTVLEEVRDGFGAARVSTLPPPECIASNTRLCRAEFVGLVVSLRIPLDLASDTQVTIHAATTKADEAQREIGRTTVLTLHRTGDGGWRVSEVGLWSHR